MFEINNIHVIQNLNLLTLIFIVNLKIKINYVVCELKLGMHWFFIPV